MSKLIHYNKKCIPLYYTNKSLSEINLKDFLNVEAKGSGEGENYRQVEQEAQLYLIKNAMLKKPRNNLNKIVGIMQDIIYDGFKLKISLEGIAVFK